MKRGQPRQGTKPLESSTPASGCARRASPIPRAKQELTVELYDTFSRNAFPRTTKKLGIVYTPVGITSFILHSVNEMLQEHFGQTLGSRGVHIIDPFTGTAPSSPGDCNQAVSRPGNWNTNSATESTPTQSFF